MIQHLYNNIMLIRCLLRLLIILLQILKMIRSWSKNVCRNCFIISLMQGKIKLVWPRKELLPCLYLLILMEISTNFSKMISEISSFKAWWLVVVNLSLCCQLSSRLPFRLVLIYLLSMNPREITTNLISWESTTKNKFFLSLKSYSGRSWLS